jgi:hypothetical protein
MNALDVIFWILVVVLVIVAALIVVRLMVVPQIKVGGSASLCGQLMALNINIFKPIVSPDALDLITRVSKIKLAPATIFGDLTPTTVKLDDPLIGADVLEYIKRNPSTLDLVDATYQIGDQKINLVSPEANTTLASKVFMCMRMVDAAFGTTINPKTIIIRTPLKKLYPIQIPNKTPSYIFTPESTNSALSWVGGLDETIVYREEELQKVLLHEFVHISRAEKFMPIDAAWTNSWAVKKNTPLLLIESITEVFAAVLNACAVGSLSNINDRLSLEATFGLLQTAKILRLSGMKSMSEFTGTGPAIHETTHTVEYHIFKTILLLNFDKFYELFLKSDSGEIMDLISTYTRNPIYIKTIDTLIALLDSGTISKELMSTGRMTIGS